MLPRASLAGGFEEEANVKRRQLQDQGKAPDRGLRARELPSLETVRNIELELDVTPFRGDGRKHIKILVAGGEGMGVTDYPMHPSGDFPLERTPHLPKLCSKSKVTGPGFGGPIPWNIVVCQSSVNHSKSTPFLACNHIVYRSQPVQGQKATAEFFGSREHACHGGLAVTSARPLLGE